MRSSLKPQKGGECKVNEDEYPNLATILDVEDKIRKTERDLVVLRWEHHQLMHIVGLAAKTNFRL
jgi:hypothetical protein